MKQNKQTLIQSFANAFRGIFHALRERNFLLQALIGLVALVAAFVLDFDIGERALVILVVALVLTAEIFNTAVEELLDLISPRLDPRVARIKELLAGAVLVCSIAALLVGLWLFGKALQ